MDNPRIPVSRVSDFDELCAFHDDFLTDATMSELHIENHHIRERSIEDLIEELEDL